MHVNPVVCCSCKPAAGALKLQTSVLAHDYATSKAALDVRLAQEQQMSISMDKWASASTEPASACYVRLADGTTALLGAQEGTNFADIAATSAGKSCVIHADKATDTLTPIALTCST